MIISDGVTRGVTVGGDVLTNDDYYARAVCALYIANIQSNTYIIYII